MGFWSGFCSFCSSVGSAVSSAVSSVGSAIKSAASTVWETAKSVASKAVGWMAEKAETFVGNVKKVWESVKPFINSHIRPFLKAAATFVPWPWLKGALLVLDKGLGYLANIDDSPFVKKVGEAVRWAIQQAKNLQNIFLSKEEEKQAEVHKEVLSEAAQQLPPEEAKSVQLAALINDFALVQTAIKKVFAENSIHDFEHYLRLRATQKLLKFTEQKLTQAESIEDITEDDIFLLKAGAGLLAAVPVLSDADALQLDGIIFSRYGKKLIPFVFEEMIFAWGQKLDGLERDWDVKNKAVAKDVVLKRRLETAKKLSELSTEEEALLSQLQIDVPKLQAEAEAIAKESQEMKNYVFAAEGFLQTLEKSPEQLQSEDKGYLAREGAQVGMIIIDCAQNGRKWESLSEEEQMLIIDYANIFKEESEQRVKQLVEVEVGA